MFPLLAFGILGERDLYYIRDLRKTTDPRHYRRTHRITGHSHIESDTHPDTTDSPDALSIPSTTPEVWTTYRRSPTSLISQTRPSSLFSGYDKSSPRLIITTKFIRIGSEIELFIIVDEYLSGRIL